MLKKITVVLAGMMLSQAASSQTVNEILPPDWFRAPGSDTNYAFPTKLEKPCESRAGYCPNYDMPDGMPEGWIIARYKSRHAGGFDSDTSSLLMVYIPSGAKVNGQVDKVHRWLNFPLPVDEAENLGKPTPKQAIPANYANGGPSTFTMVSLTEGSPATVHFTMFSRIGDTAEWSHGGQMGASSLSSCHRCHPNGLRAISPLGYHVNAEEAADVERMLQDDNWDAVKLINDSMDETSRGRVLWDQGFDPTDSKVFMGTPGPGTRTKAFILGTGTEEECSVSGSTADCGCARSTDNIRVTDIFGRPPGQNNIYEMDRSAALSYKKIKSAMNCSGCHNDINRGAINTRISYSQIAFKVLVDRSMPVGFHGNPLDSGAQFDRLDTNHRIGLMNCLKAEMRINEQNETN